MIKKILTSAFCVFALLVIADNIKAQSIYFAEDVSTDGYPITESSVFNISRNGGYFDVLVRLPYEVNCRSVRYEIYRNGKYSTTIYQDTERNWVWFYKQITFYDPGTYDIDVYDCYDYRLISGSVRVQYK
jgi:hypothetical protein